MIEKIIKKEYVTLADINPVIKKKIGSNAMTTIRKLAGFNLIIKDDSYVMTIDFHNGSGLITIKTEDHYYNKFLCECTDCKQRLTLFEYLLSYNITLTKFPHNIKLSKEKFSEILKSYPQYKWIVEYSDFSSYYKLYDSKYNVTLSFSSVPCNPDFLNSSCSLFVYPGNISENTNKTDLYLKIEF